MLRGPDDPVALIPANGVFAVVRFIARSRLHLDEDDRRRVGCDQVDLTRFAAIVANQEAIAGAFQVPRGDTLPERPQGDPVIRRRPPAWRQAL